MLFFDGWGSLVRAVTVTTAGYLLIILLTRVAGKRSLSKMTAFDFVINVAIGTTLMTTALSSEVPLLAGASSLVVLVGLQTLLAWITSRSGRARSLLKDEPSLLYYRGEYQDATLRRERVTINEVVSAVRQHGSARIEQVEAVVLETSGDLAVVMCTSDRPTALDGLVGAREQTP